MQNYINDRLFKRWHTGHYPLMLTIVTVNQSLKLTLKKYDQVNQLKINQNYDNHLFTLTMHAVKTFIETRPYYWLLRYG